MKSRYGIDVILSEPKIPYRETIKAVATAEGKHKKQSGGHGQYGHCKVRFEPCESEFEFGDEVVGGAVPRQYIPAVEKGLRECMARGVLADYPVTGVRAVLFDGSYHDVDSSEMAFKMAAALAFRDGILKAKPTLLEPVMKLKVAVSDDCLGAVLGDRIKTARKNLRQSHRGRNFNGDRRSSACGNNQIRNRFKGLNARTGQVHNRVFALRGSTSSARRKDYFSRKASLTSQMPDRSILIT